jgi:NADP-dependent aldehyde dehydrogenase
MSGAVPPSTRDDLDRAVAAAHRAYEVSQASSPDVRAGWLEAVAAAMEAHDTELLHIAAGESHIPEAQLRRELARSVFQIRLFCDELVRGEILDATVDHADEGWGMGPRPDLRRVNVPLGVVGVFGASNFPFAFSVMGGDTTSALAAGCGVVHKVHEAHETLGLRTREVAAEALARAGAPEGLFATVTGREAGELLVEHPMVRAVGFTGSTRVGRLLFEKACARAEPIPFYGELGSVNPVFVTPAAWARRRDEILTGYAQSFTLGMGQFCTKPGLLFVPGSDAADLAAVEQALAGVSPTPMLTPRLADGYGEAVRGASQRPGVSVVVDGGSGDSPRPTLLVTTAEAVRRDPELLEREMFGPASVVVRYESASELVQVAQLLQGQLTTTLHAEAGEPRDDLVRVLESRSGRVILNGWPTGVTVTYAQVHGGPYPATTSAGTTSVGTGALRRFLRPVAYQGFGDDRLPPPLQEANPWRIRRRVDGRWVDAPAGEGGS